MRSLPDPEPDVDRRWVTRVLPDPMLRFDTNDYSLDPRLAGRRVEVRISQREIVAVDRALSEDGASAALGADGEVAPDPDLTAALREACGGRAVIAVSTDLFYDRREGLEQSWVKRGAAVVEMEAATLFQAALVHGVRAGCVLGVSDVIGDGRTRIGHEQLAELGVQIGEVAFEALERASSTAR